MVRFHLRGRDYFDRNQHIAFLNSNAESSPGMMHDCEPKEFRLSLPRIESLVPGGYHHDQFASTFRLRLSSEGTS